MNVAERVDRWLSSMSSEQRLDCYCLAGGISASLSAALRSKDLALTALMVIISTSGAVKMNDEGRGGTEEVSFWRGLAIAGEVIILTKGYVGFSLFESAMIGTVAAIFSRKIIGVDYNKLLIYGYLLGVQHFYRAIFPSQADQLMPLLREAFPVR